MADPDKDPYLEGEAETIEFKADRTPDTIDQLPGLARIAATAAWHTAGWALQTSLAASRRAVEATSSPREALRLARDVRHGTESVLRDLIRATGGDALIEKSTAPDTDALASRSNGRRPARSLREQGEQLMHRSRDVHDEVDAHPAYSRILSELAPDEARVLRLLLLSGPQPSVDVRTGGPLGLVSSRLIAPGISMIGARAGCRYVDRVPSYLNNLYRLGLVWFSRETIRDHMKYQVLEAQPEVLDAIHSVSAAKIVRRSIHLTPFGEDFCRTCLVFDTPLPAVLPAHSSPREGKATAQPPTDPNLDG
ncbi:MAG: Abi-alpha family protein [Solirubrobacteraceae bacterium]